MIKEYFDLLFSVSCSFLSYILVFFLGRGYGSKTKRHILVLRSASTYFGTVIPFYHLNYRKLKPLLAHYSSWKTCFILSSLWNQDVGLRVIRNSDICALDSEWRRHVFQQWLMALHSWSRKIILINILLWL